jgi:hypothetical protein
MEQCFRHLYKMPLKIVTGSDNAAAFLQQLINKEREYRIPKREFDAELREATRTRSIKGWVADPFVKDFFEVTLPITKMGTQEVDGTTEYTVSYSDIKKALRLPETADVTSTRMFHSDTGTQYTKICMEEFVWDFPYNEGVQIDCDGGQKTFTGRILLIEERSMYRGCDDDHILVNKSFTKTDWMRSLRFVGRRATVKSQKEDIERTRRTADANTIVMGHAGVQPNTCASCGKTEKLRKCSKCKAIYYCGEECQRADWRKHKGLCLK